MSNERGAIFFQGVGVPWTVAEWRDWNLSTQLPLGTLRQAGRRTEQEAIMILHRPGRAASTALDLSRTRGLPVSFGMNGSNPARWLDLSVATAVAVHIVIMATPFPMVARTGPQAEQKKSAIYVLKQVKFKQPPKVFIPAQPGIRRCSIPDQTPDQLSFGYAPMMAPVPPSPRWAPNFNTTTHPNIIDNSWVHAADSPVSTFSIDVDSASLAMVRQYLNRHQLPPPGAVRTEEIINAFKYNDAPPSGSDPFAVHLALSDCPWQPDHLLARVALKGKVIANASRPRANLVFLIDVSGSMRDRSKLPLVRTALTSLVNEGLRGDDTVGIVVYAGAAGVVLPPTSGAERDVINDAIRRLEAGGNTDGSAGIQLAYELVRQAWVENGINRVMLVTDGDFNVGVTSNGALVRLIQNEAASGIFLTVLGVGSGNYKDNRLEQLADKGNGNYAYLDTMDEARRVLVENVGGTLHTIARDVKVQVELNPAEVQAYRLLGYENRLLDRRDFNDDKVDAGELGAGHSVVALYEIVPTGAGNPAVTSEQLRYQAPPRLTSEAHDPELFTVKLRYKAPDGERSQLLSCSLHLADYGPMSPDFSFAAGAALIAMILRDSDHRGIGTVDTASRLLNSGIDRGQKHRIELASLVARSRGLIEAATRR